jgi:nucleoside-diphosphate-sugar epimerase
VAQHTGHRHRLSNGKLTRIVLLGAGPLGLEIVRQALRLGLAVVATTRKPEKAEALRHLFPIESVKIACASTIDRAVLPELDAETRVIATYPPDEATDAVLATWAACAGSVVRISSTSVYGAREGVIDDATPAEASSRALLSEETWRRGMQGAPRETGQSVADFSVFRCPALYSQERGVHVRIARGEFRIPGDGSRYVSRVHDVDVARATLLPKLPSELLVGDLEPATHLDVARFICERLQVPLPPFVPLEEVHTTLRGNRQIHAHAFARVLGTLGYPTYREGLAFLGPGFFELQKA